LRNKNAWKTYKSKVTVHHTYGIFVVNQGTADSDYNDFEKGYGVDSPQKVTKKSKKPTQTLGGATALIFGTSYLVYYLAVSGFFVIFLIKSGSQLTQVVPAEIISFASENVPDLAQVNSDEVATPVYVPQSQTSQLNPAANIAPKFPETLDVFMAGDDVSLQIAIKDKLAIALSQEAQKDNYLSPRPNIANYIDDSVRPKPRPKAFLQISSLITKKKYDKLNALETPKKEFLLDAAKDFYKANKGNKIPNSILIAMAAHETDWGNSRFYKKGNNYFNLVAEKNEDFIRAYQSNQKVSKHNNKLDSIEKFLNWIDNKDHYQVVRDTLKKFEYGNATKDSIIDAIASTGFAEDPKWAINVKFTHTNRIDGKNKNELNGLFLKLFEDTLSAQ
jgi:flagellum-specific peptidoglycan hydrolase FlgJ